MNTQTATKDISDVQRTLPAGELKRRIEAAEQNAKSVQTLYPKSSISSISAEMGNFEDFEDFEDGESTESDFPLQVNFEDFEDFEDGESTESDFPLHLLPSVVSDFAHGVSKSKLVPASLPAACALGTLSAAIGSGLVIESGGERETRGNLFLTPIAKSGTGKGQAYGEVTQPLFEIERSRCEQWTLEDKPHILAEIAVTSAELEHAKKSAVKASDGMERAEHRDKVKTCLQEIAKLEAENREPILTVSDITREALAEALSKSNRETLSSMSAEARGALDVLAGRYNDATDEDIHLAGFSGDGIKMNRRTHPAIVLHSPCLSLLWLMQPDKLREILAKPALCESGWFQRCLVFDTHTEPAYAPEIAHVIQRDVKARWQSLIENLVTTYNEHTGEAYRIKSSKAAQDVMRNYYNETVTRRRAGGDLADVNIYAARWQEQAWRLSVVMHAAEYGAEAHNHELSEPAAREAIELVQWFAAQQLSILNEGREARKAARLEKLVEILKTKPAQACTLRDMKARHSFEGREVKELAAANPLTLVIEPAERDGAGRPSFLVRLTIS